MTFANLASYGAQSGSAAATAVGTAGEHCTVSSWTSNGTPDMTVTVRCFSAAGAPADTVFDASYIRPTASSAPFAYLWAQDPAAAAYTPSTYHQFNSTGATNTIVRHSAGDYTVTLPGLASSGGTVKVTAFSATPSYCKASEWDAAGADEQVDVLCFDFTGAPVDAKFTLAFADDTSILANGAASGYVWANDAAAPAYTPNSAYQYNSTGATNTIARTATGRYTVTFPGLGSSLFATNAGIVHVTAHHTTSKRCELVGYRSGSVAADHADPALRRRRLPHRGGHAVGQQVRRAVHALDAFSLGSMNLERAAPRGAALVVGTTQGIWSRGVAPDAVFEIGSISKTFTATLLAALVEDGVVALDDPVARFLPVAPPVNARAITLEDLATHHSGLPRLPKGMLAKSFTAERHDPYASFDATRLQHAIAETAPKRAPGRSSPTPTTATGCSATPLPARRERPTPSSCAPASPSRSASPAPALTSSRSPRATACSGAPRTAGTWPSSPARAESARPPATWSPTSRRTRAASCCSPPPTPGAAPSARSASGSPGSSCRTARSATTAGRAASAPSRASTRRPARSRSSWPPARAR